MKRTEWPKPHNSCLCIVITPVYRSDGKGTQRTSLAHIIHAYPGLCPHILPKSPLSIFCGTGLSDTQSSFSVGIRIVTGRRLGRNGSVDSHGSLPHTLLLAVCLCSVTFNYIYLNATVCVCPCTDVCTYMCMWRHDDSLDVIRRKAIHLL